MPAEMSGREKLAKGGRGVRRYSPELVWVEVLEMQPGGEKAGTTCPRLDPASRRKKQNEPGGALKKKKKTYKGFFFHGPAKKRKGK